MERYFPVVWPEVSRQIFESTNTPEMTQIFRVDGRSKNNEIAFAIGSILVATKAAIGTTPGAKRGAIRVSLGALKKLLDLGFGQ